MAFEAVPPLVPGPASPPVQPWARAACWTACLCALPSAAWRVAMMTGADAGFGRADLYRGSAEGTAYVVTLELLQVGAGLLCLGLCQSWGERAPRWVPAAGGRTIPRTLPLLLGGAGNLLLYLIIYPVALLFGLALLSEPPSWTPIEGMSVGQRTVFSLCYAPMLLWPIALTTGLVGYWRRHRLGGARARS
ncbi:hypothetical protein [Actinomyces gerencseriae]|uniref:hypothetical protein n=1 Tax=Actinomyces gerencseriae TaxID=52769 RepID=UPI0028ED724A|nr:hypothetical protein [Actinomyces gerencseriae]